MKEEKPFIDSVIEDLYKQEDLKETLSQYDFHFGTLKGKDFKESEIYKRYLSQFAALPFTCHDASQYDDIFDWDLLYRFIFASASMEYYFKINKSQDSLPQIDLHMVVVKGSEDRQRIDKILAELWSFQIIRLYYIFLTEQIELFVISLVEEDDEDSSYSQLMKDKIARFQLLKDKVLIELELYELV